MPRVDEPRISVCMASYNGADFIEVQIRSILMQLGSGDELIVVDDASSDSTARVIVDLQDPRIVLVVNSVNRGHVRAFESSLSLARGEIILLADQDDVWAPGRVDVMQGLLLSASVCATSFTEFPAIRGGVTRGFKGQRVARSSVVYKLLTGGGAYFGCAMGMNASMLNVILPIPQWVEAHDHWLALSGAVCGGVAESSDITVFRRLHGGNLTPRTSRPIARRILSRLHMVRSLVVLRIRRLKCGRIRC